MEEKDHYEKEYFEWQKEMGKIGGILEQFKFEKFLDENDIVLDFGCGEVCIRQIKCKRKTWL